MKPIMPFEILSTRHEDGGIGVTYKVSKKSIQENRLQTETMESFVLVPEGEDVEGYVYGYLAEAGWIE